MHGDPTFVFLQWVMLALQLLLTLLLWALVFLRLRSIEHSNAQFPSLWRTTSKVCIVVAGILCTGYVIVLIPKTAMSGVTWFLASSKHLPEDSITLDDFTTEEIATILRYMGQEQKLMFAARALLFFALWISKLAVICFFLGNEELLVSFQRKLLRATAIITFIMLVVGTWASFTPPDGSTYTSTYIFDFTPADIVPYQLWRGCAFMVLLPYQEYILASFSLVADVLLTATGLCIIRRLPSSSGGMYLLIGTLSFTTLIALTRLAIFRVGIQIRDATEIPQEVSSKLDATFIFLADAEVLFSIMVSCISGVRAWFRGTNQRQKNLAAITAGVLNRSEPKGNMNVVIGPRDIEELHLQFLEELRNT